MLKLFTTERDANFHFLKGKNLLVACSGGVDSVVLTHLCVRSGLNVTLAHCNFNLRGKESDVDEVFVKGMGDELGIPVLSKSFDTQKYVQQNRGSVQMAARNLRYGWFTELLEDDYDFVLTAHHADDNLETFLINLSRGTGLDGLQGIPVRNGKIVRPLLSFSRAQILEYAENNKVQWREDSSNAQSKYLRNKIRHDVVPKLKELHPTFLDNFKRTQLYLGQADVLIKNHLKQIQKNLVFEEEGVVRIRIEALLKLQPVEAYLFQLLNPYGFSEWNDVVGLLTAMSGKEVLSKSHRLLKDRDYLILSKRENETQNLFMIEEGRHSIDIPISMTIEEVESINPSSKNVAYIDKEKLNYPLILRNWQKGDYFYPFGMQGRKKLSKFFKDEKVDVFSKEKKWLLCSNDEIVWVVGMRTDDRFKVDPTTKNILKFTLSI